MSQNTKLSWQAPEFKHYEKNAGWYVTLIAIAALVMGFFVIVQEDYFAAVTMAILTIFIVLFSRQKPQIVEIHLTHKGLHQGNIHVPYKQMKHFWVVHDKNHKTVNFETSAYLNKLMVIELEEQNPDEVREFLLEFLPESEQVHPSLTQRVMHFFKF